jgi:hypothetical protein
VAEEYWWAKTQATGRSYCGRSGSGVFGFGFHRDSLWEYVYIAEHTHTVLRLPSDLCARISCRLYTEVTLYPHAYIRCRK